MFSIRHTPVLAVLTLLTTAATAADLILLPESIALTHAGQHHGVLAGSGTDGQWHGPVAGETLWSSSAPEIATVDASGTIVAVADGEATITATSNGKMVSIPVTVTGAGAPPTRSFVNDIQPVLFKTGCSTGPCHGAASGKNGFSLSLRGYDHGRDYDVLTRQAKGRRISSTLR